MQVPLTESDFNLDGFKQLVRHIKSNWPTHLCSISLSQAQELLSRCLGYKDYHNAQQSSAGVISCNQLAFESFIPAFQGEVLDFLYKNCESKYIYQEYIRVKVRRWPVDMLTAFTTHDGTRNYAAIFSFIEQDFKTSFKHGIENVNADTPADSASRILVANDVNNLLQSNFRHDTNLNMFMERDRAAGSTAIMEHLRSFAGKTALQLLEYKKGSNEFIQCFSEYGFDLIDESAFAKGFADYAWEYIVENIAGYGLRDLFENDLNECGFYGLSGEVNITPDKAANLNRTNYGFSKLSVFEAKCSHDKVQVMHWDFRLYNNSGELTCYASGLIFTNKHPLSVGQVELLEAAELHGEVTRLNVEALISEISKDCFTDSIEDIFQESNLVIIKEWERQTDSNFGVGRKCLDLAAQELCEKFQKKITIAAVMRLPNYKYWAGDPPEVVIYDALDAVEKIGLVLYQIFNGDNNSVRYCYEILPDLIGNDPGIF